MRYGFYLPTRGQTASPEALETLVARGEALGFSSVVIADHIVFPVTIKSKYPYTVSGAFPGQGDALEQLSLMAFVAGKSRTLRLISERDDPAPPQPGGDRQDARHHRRALARARHGGRRGGLAARGVRGARRAGLRPARRGERRVPAHLQGAVDAGSRLVPRGVLSLRLDALRAPSGAEAAPADLDRRAQQGGAPARGAPGRRLASGRRQPGRAAAPGRDARAARRAVPPHRGGGARSCRR